MMRRLRCAVKLLFIFILAISVTGCTIIFQAGKRSHLEKIESLDKTRRLLEKRLEQEIADKEIRLEMAEKGLVITFVADILFNSGKAKIRSSAYPTLDKVAQVLIESVPDMNIGVEGHTDNVPIKFSKWKSNWELSAQRALSVLHYLVDKEGIEGSGISAIGYGEFQPVASNGSKEGRQLNRRVEVVVLPRVTKVKPQEDYPLEESTSEMPEDLNLK